MKKIIDTPTVQYTVYDPNCPFDTAQSIMDDLDGVDPYDILRIVQDLYESKGLNDFGKLILSALHAIEYESVSRFAKTPEQYEKECKMFEEWKQRTNAIEVKAAPVKNKEVARAFEMAAKPIKERIMKENANEAE